MLRLPNMSYPAGVSAEVYAGRGVRVDPSVAAARAASGRLVALFAATLFLSAFLMFLIEPMIARMVLPLLGGAPAVWNTCLVFFQAMLLAGYAYAHGATEWLGVRRHVAVHSLLLLAPLLALPFAIQHGATPGTGSPVLWLLFVLLTSIGLPFFVLSTSAAVLQKWFSSTDDAAARDPYFLYTASNIGSFLALIAYPALVEPALRLHDQTRLWTAGYAVFVLLTLLCAVAVWRRTSARGRLRTSATPPITATIEEASPITWRLRGHWLALSLVPSSLLMAVTAYISTNVASMPLLWIVPLLLYLLTFMVAFNPAAVRTRAAAARAMPLLVVVLAVLLAAQIAGPLWLVIPLHLLTFFASALVCHAELASRRPAAARLTEFYLWIALGGMLGGLFNALIAPIIFVGIAEYPLALVLACLLRRNRPATPGRSRLADVAVPLTVGALAAGLILLSNRLGADSRLSVLAIAVPALFCYGQSRRPQRFAGCIAMVLLAGLLAGSPFGRVVYAERTFFGVYQVRLDPANRYRWLFHGTTLHGMQRADDQPHQEPLSYFHRTGPIGQVFAALPQAAAAREIAVVGLGVGSLASYAGPAERWTFYEIDPAVERIARNERYFTYMRDCGERCHVVIGDARLSLARAGPHQYGLIVLDAFSSDAIPVHLMTTEAMALYVSRLAPGGAIAFHISNMHLALSPVLARVAAAQGLTALWQQEPPTAGSLEAGKFPSEWMVFARDRRDLGALTSDRRWIVPLVGPSVPLWTDDFSNILSVVKF